MSCNLGAGVVRHAQPLHALAGFCLRVHLIWLELLRVVVMEVSVVQGELVQGCVETAEPRLPRPVPSGVAVSWALEEVHGALKDPALNCSALIGSERRNLAQQVAGISGLLGTFQTGSSWLMPPDAVEYELKSVLGRAALALPAWISDMRNIAAVVNEVGTGLGVHYAISAGKLSDVVLDSHRGRHIDYVKRAAVVTYVGSTTNFYDNGDVLFDEVQIRQETMAVQLGRSLGRFRPFNLGLREGAPVYRLHAGEVLFFCGSEENPRQGFVHSAPLYENGADPDSFRLVFSAFVPE